MLSLFHSVRRTHGRTPVLPGRGRRPGVGEVLGGVVGEVAGFDEGFHAGEVSVHFGLRVGGEEGGEGVAQRAAGGVVGHADVDAGGAVGVFDELDGAGAGDDGAGDALPGDAAVDFEVGEDGVPFDLESGRTGDNPVGGAVAVVADFLHVSHEEGEVLVVGPEAVDEVDRRVDVDGLADVDGARAAGSADHLAGGKVGDGPP